MMRMMAMTMRQLDNYDEDENLSNDYKPERIRFFSGNFKTIPHSISASAEHIAVCFSYLLN